MIGRGEGQPKPPVLVLMAAWNEEKGIGPTVLEMKQVLSECKVLVVDGNSKDQTAIVAKKLGAEVLHQEGRGKGNAIGLGIQKASQEDYEYVVLTDADHTYPAEYVPRMIELLESNPTVGMVCGNRFNSRLHIGAMRDSFYFGNRLIAFVHNLLNGVALQDPLSGLRVVRWGIMKNWKPKSASFDVEVELNHHVERQGYSIAEIEIPYRKRIGEKKLKMRHGATIIGRILSESAY
jgi:glycosyltransferase involved in cell wall biosynthesis